MTAGTCNPDLAIMNTPSSWTVRWLEAIDKVTREQWDNLALPLSTPLLEWQWLHDLEASGSISPRYGWQPCHLTIWDRQELIGAAPFYLKTHSGGEFVFDHWWAQLAEEYGIAYYPKLVGMSPVTPIVGYRFLMSESVDQVSLGSALLSAIDQFCRQNRITGCHLHFVDAPWFAQLPLPEYMVWRHQSYLWKNRNFRSFDDYLATFNSSQRRNIRRECCSMEKQGIEIRGLTGDMIPPELAAAMYRYYLNTNERYGLMAARYLNGEFFRRVFYTFRHRLLVFAAYTSRSSEPIALSMLLVKNGQLIGRYWGSATPVRDLHFNMCFYAPIRWAIDNGIDTIDPGVGAPHKLLRGFEAVTNTSLHRFFDARLNHIFEQLIDKVNAMEDSAIASLNQRLPFKKNRDTAPFTS